MCQKVTKKDEAAVVKDFPIAGLVPGWYFRLKEVSAGVYTAEGADLWGRSVSKSGTDEQALLTDCAEMARNIQRQLASGSGTIKYECFDDLPNHIKTWLLQRVGPGDPHEWAKKPIPALDNQSVLEVMNGVDGAKRIIEYLNRISC